MTAAFVGDLLKASIAAGPKASPTHDEIAQAAHLRWQMRVVLAHETSQDDWFAAERELTP